MDKIQRALDKAREDRPHRTTMSGAWRLRSGEPVGDIVYTETQVLSANAKHMTDQRLIANVRNDPNADAYKILRTKILQTIKNRSISSIAMISARSDEGKTLTAINLALSLTMSGNHSVLLVDCDLRNPDVHKRFGIEPEFGLSDYLAGNVDLQKCLVSPGINRLVVLPQIRSHMDSSELLASRKMGELVRELTMRYPDRLVIFDLPPLLGTDDALVFLNFSDACLLVTREGETQLDELRRVADLVRDKVVIGAVMNDVTGFF